jgi:hypothetical protein
MNETKTLRFIKEYWQIMVMIAALITAWTTLRGDVSEHSKRITKLEVHQEKTDATFLSLQVSLQEIKTKLEFIQQAITKK